MTAAGPALPNPPSASPAGSLLRVLMIDDEPNVMAWLINYLNQHGCRVDCVCTAADGFASAERLAHDVIVLDWKLPDRDGLSVLGDFRAAGVETPVVLLSGYMTSDLALEAGRAGARAAKPKPISGRGLLATMRHLTGRGGAGSHPGADDHAWSVHVKLLFDQALEDLAGRRGMTREDWQSVVRQFAGLLAEPAITIVETLNGLEALAGLYRGRGRETGAEAILRSAREIATREPPFVFSRLSAAVASAVTRFEAGGGDATHLLEAAFARELHIDPAHFGRELTKGTTISYERWRSGARCRRAIAELVHTTERIEQIATASGWPSLDSMERQFRELVGLSPTELRETAWRR